MITRKVFSRALFLTACALAAAACSGGNSDTGTFVASTGPPSTLVVRWSVAGTIDPNQCIVAGANAIEISVVDPNGLEVGAFQQVCRAFSTSITLPAGNYSANALLVDSANEPRTTAVNIAPFVLLGNDQLVITVDFPPSSFLF